MTQKEIKIRECAFPVPGKWTIETKEGEFILTNETDTPATIEVIEGCAVERLAFIEVDK